MFSEKTVFFAQEKKEKVNVNSKFICLSNYYDCKKEDRKKYLDKELNISVLLIETTTHAVKWFANETEGRSGDLYSESSCVINGCFIFLIKFYLLSGKNGFL